MISQAGKPAADGEQVQNLFIWEPDWAVHSVFVRSFLCYIPFSFYNLSLFFQEVQ